MMLLHFITTTVLIILGVLMAGSSQVFAVIYDHSSDLLTYDLAAENCNARGGHLMTPQSVQELSHMIEATGIGGGRLYWIGIRSDDGERWTYDGGAPLTDWAENRVATDSYDYDTTEDDDPSKCLAISTSAYVPEAMAVEASINPCHLSFRYICEFSEEEPTTTTTEATTSVDSTTTTTTAPECPEDFDQVGDVCLTLVEEEKPYNAAREHCGNIGARLTTPTNEALYNQLLAWDQMASRPQLTIWLGLSNLGQTDQTNYIWENEEHTPLALTWSSFKGDQVRPKDSSFSKCVTARKQMPKMRGFDCETRSFPFVCETRLD